MCLHTVPAFTDSSDADEIVHVMVQGVSYDKVYGVVTGAGGQITHELAIIDAVGVKLTRRQLAKVMASPDILRHIDDLDLPEEPESDDDEGNCRVRGHIELDVEGSTVRWHLYNKRRQFKQAISHYEAALRSKPGLDDAQAKILHL
ncbi:MAG: hypothetical protein ACPG1A_09395, partial [Halioglobus sp.]